MLNYLRSADTCLTRTVIYWLSVPAITDSAAAIWWPQAIFHIESKFLRYETRDCGNSDHLVTSVLRHHVIKVTYSMLNPRSWRRERFLVLTNAHHVERLPSSWCGKTQIARIEANRVATKSHRGRAVFGRPAWYEILCWLQVFAYCTIPQLIYYYDALILGSITIA